ncbi:mucin-5AC-like isoform X1 [Quillaja saponaria]|uniref:Mucin-5AC-like isoform X1 n=1 Tax=Quillaja saponaria TaxID=32244 RepID=A0AAD7LN76_QUISA|nr:mucin-5AC-like isoform X1 [Quillaja saponaria]KAJ7961252.1 mucin-5AC-like isoform X1 [Quillaja saponaria]
MVMKERDEELTLFLEMRRREKENENEKNNLLLPHDSDELDASNLESNCGSSPISKILSSVSQLKNGAVGLVNSENEKSDYDWLLTPPGTPLFPSLEMESHNTVLSQIEIPNTRPTALKSRLANVEAVPASRSKVASKHPTVTSGLNTSTIGNNRRPSSSGGVNSTTSRSVTPAGRPTLPSKTNPSRPSTHASQAKLPSTKPTDPPVRSYTPKRSTARSSIPTARPSLSASKTTPRSATPTHRSSTPSRVPGVSAPPNRSSSASKARPTLQNNPVQSRGISPAVKSRPWKPSEMPGFSADAPQNLRTSLPERPVSTSRSKPGAPSFRSSLVETASIGKLRRDTCSPSKGRTLTGSGHGNRSFFPAMSKSRYRDGDNVNPVEIGTKMVERVVNMRRLAPPMHDHYQSSQNNLAGKSSISDSFGRTLSKKSLDMAMRHMDIRRSFQGNLRPLVTNRSGSTKSHIISVSDSPLGTCSNASSERSVNNNTICLDGNEIEDRVLVSER